MKLFKNLLSEIKFRLDLHRLRKCEVTARGECIYNYCEKVVNGTLTSTIDDYEDVLNSIHKDREVAALVYMQLINLVKGEV